MRLPLMMIIFLFAISILTDLYIWKDIRQGKSPRRWHRSGIYAVSSIILWIFLIVTICIPRRSLGGEMYAVMWMLTTYISIYIPKIIYCAFSILGRIPTLFKAKRWRWTKYVGIVCALVAFFGVWEGIIFGRKHIQTVRTELTSTRLPESFDGYRIVQISDLHLGTWGDNTAFVSKMVDSINALKPDLIVFSGDLVNQKATETEPFIEVLSRLKAKDGVYSILGNHDYGDYVDWNSPQDKIDNLNRLKENQAKMGWKMLNNDHAFIYKTVSAPTDSVLRRDSIALIGVENWGEPPFGQYGDLKKAYPAKQGRSLNDKNFKILLTHNPEHWVRDVRKESNIDLSLSGHTHAMQMSLSAGGKRWSPSEWKYETWGGFYSDEKDGDIEDYGSPAPSKEGWKHSLDTPGIYVNIGSGEVAMPYRIGTSYPEITLLTLKNP